MSVLDTKEGREALISACRLWSTSPNFAANLVAIEDDEKGPNWADEKYRALVDTNDPAKLAELMASEGRRLGWPTLDEMPDECAHIACMSIVPFGDAAVSIAFWYEGAVADPTWIQNVDLPKARRIFAKWLQLPDGAREQAERVLRGET